MPLSFLSRVTLLGGLLVAALPSLVIAQSGYVTNGLEYPITGLLPGDQLYPSVAFGSTNGYLVWQDNITDGNGLGISGASLPGWPGVATMARTS